MYIVCLCVNPSHVHAAAHARINFHPVSHTHSYDYKIPFISITSIRRFKAYLRSEFANITWIPQFPNARFRNFEKKKRGEGKRKKSHSDDLPLRENLIFFGTTLSPKKNPLAPFSSSSSLVFLHEWRVWVRRVCTAAMYDSAAVASKGKEPTLHPFLSFPAKNWRGEEEGTRE